MADEIKADYDQLGQIASRLASQSDVVQQVIQKVKGSMEPLQSGGWIGRAADAFFDEMNSEVLPATDRLQKVLDQASQVTKQIVQTVRQAEDEASSLFRSQ